jgi:hypothetical protein
LDGQGARHEGRSHNLAAAVATTGHGTTAIAGRGLGQPGRFGRGSSHGLLGERDLDSGHGMLFLALYGALGQRDVRCDEGTIASHLGHARFFQVASGSLSKVSLQVPRTLLRPGSEKFFHEYFTKISFMSTLLKFLS